MDKFLFKKTTILQIQPANGNKNTARGATQYSMYVLNLFIYVATLYENAEKAFFMHVQQIGLNTKRHKVVSSLGPTKPLPSYY
jgi:hypothetical protein